MLVICLGTFLGPLNGVIVGVALPTLSEEFQVDIQSVTQPHGTYATVRRYAFSILTDVYDVFYPFEFDTSAFNPLVVNFERKVRVAPGLDDGNNEFRIADQEPFYFMWWPDL